MYHVIKMDSTDLGITDSINYIRISEDGCFVPTDQEHAIGVAVDSVPYNLIGHDEIEGAETVVVSEIDAGRVMKEMASYSELAAAIREGVNQVD